MRTPARPARRIATAAATLALAATALAGCSGGSDSGSASDSGAGGSVTQEDRAVGGDTSGGVQEPAVGAPAKPGQAPAAVAPAVYERKLSRRADISLAVDDVDAAASRVRSIAIAADGLVLAESIASEPDLPDQGGYSTVTISVPTQALDSTLDQVSKLGTAHARNA